MTTRTLYRPVGLRELELVLDVEARAFPPRLAAQPIFYPVLNREYADEIASKWNPLDEVSGFAGFVTDFDVDAEYLRGFEPKTVGAARHQELWVPSEELSGFNAHITSKIRTTSAFYGPSYQGPKPLPLGLRSDRASEQLEVLHGTLAYSGFDFALEIAAQWKLVLCNFGFWAAAAPEVQGLTADEVDKTLAAIRKVWEPRHPDLPLPAGVIVKEA